MVVRMVVLEVVVVMKILATLVMRCVLCGCINSGNIEAAIKTQILHRLYLMITHPP